MISIGGKTLDEQQIKVVVAALEAYVFSLEGPQPYPVLDPVDQASIENAADDGRAVLEMLGHPVQPRCGGVVLYLTKDLTAEEVPDWVGRRITPNGYRISVPEKYAIVSAGRGMVRILEKS